MNFQPFKNATAAALRLSAGDKLKLINDITDHLDMGGWSCPDRDGVSRWDVTAEDAEEEWSKLEAAYVESMDGGEPPPAFNVALLVATEWERGCWGVVR